MKVGYFTAGTVGAGHLVRGLAIGRGLRRAGFTGAYRMFGPALPFALAERRADYETVEIRHDEALRNPRLAAGSEIARRLLDFAPDLLVVDMFWAPLYWVLPHVVCQAWLLVRTCPARWLQGPPAAPFDASHYERILGIEPIEAPELTDHIDPIVIANPEDQRPAGDLRRHLGLSPEARLELVVHAGERGEMRELRRVAGDDARELDLRDAEALFPAAEWLGEADRIVCGAGYNSFWEAHWLGYAQRTTFVPFARTIDDQAARLDRFGSHQPRENGADTLARWILDL